MTLPFPPLSRYGGLNQKFVQSLLKQLHVSVNEICCYHTRPISSSHEYETRLASKIIILPSFCQDKLRKFNLRFMEAFLWNNMEESLKNLSFYKFKYCLKNYIISSY